MSLTSSPLRTLYRCPASPLIRALSLPGCYLSLIQQQKAGFQYTGNITETKQDTQLGDLPASFHV